MIKRKLKKEEIRKDPFREFLGKAFSEIETSLEENWKAYLIGFAIVVLSVAAIYFYMEERQLKYEKNLLLVSEILEISDAPIMAKDNPDRQKYLNSGMKVYLSEEEKSEELNKKINEFMAGGPNKNQKSIVLMVKAADLAKKKSYDESLKILEEISKNSPFKVSALLLKAKIYEIQSDYSKEENVYKEISTLEAKDLPKPFGMEMLGEFYQKNGKKDEALKAYNEALKFLEDKKAKLKRNDNKPPETFILGNDGNQDQLETRLKEKVRELSS